MDRNADGVWAWGHSNRRQDSGSHVCRLVRRIHTTAKNEQPETQSDLGWGAPGGCGETTSAGLCVASAMAGPAGRALCLVAAVVVIAGLAPLAAGIIACARWSTLDRSIAHHTRVVPPSWSLWSDTMQGKRRRWSTQPRPTFWPALIRRTPLTPRWPRARITLPRTTGPAATGDAHKHAATTVRKSLLATRALRQRGTLLQRSRSWYVRGSSRSDRLMYPSLSRHADRLTP